MPSVISTNEASVSKTPSSKTDSIKKDFQGKKEHLQHLAPFSVKDLRDAIPAHCFERNLLMSSAYLLGDLVAVACLFFVAYYYNNNYANQVSWIVGAIFWNCYWFVQGAVMTGIWVIAHECGHQAFSKWKIVNNSVGWVLHSALLVPYHSWRISHSTHHKATSHMSRDQVYVPKVRSQVDVGKNDVHNAIADSPIIAITQILIMLFLGWPFYIATNAWGQNYGRRTNHFEPSSPIFKPSHKWDVIMSDVGMILTIIGLTYFSMSYSFVSMLKYYFGAYLWVNFWLVLITYLQHTDKRVPHYRGEEWNFIRGALCTVDRDYGIFNIVHHHIGDTHVAHHLFSQMPHYHAQEATEAIKKVLGDYYLTDNTNFMVALWNAWNTCHYVDDQGDILYYKKINSGKKD